MIINQTSDNLKGMLIYQITNTINGHKYIGLTTRPPKYRWREHRYALKAGTHGNIYLQNVYNKHGIECLKFEIIKECATLEELNKAEIELIKNSSNLYNLASGGNGFTHEERAKRAIGKSNKIPIVGMNIKTKEIREYLSASDTKLDGFNEKCVRKCCERFVATRKDGTTFKTISHKGWVFMNKNEYNETEMINRVEEAKRGKIRKERAVIGMNVFTQELVRFTSAAEASRHGFHLTNVWRACNIFSAVHKGFVWSYNDIDDPESLLEKKRKYALSRVRTGPKSWQF